MKIEKIDADTFYVESSELMENGKPLKYMVFHSWRKGWTCDCLNFVFNLKDTNDKPTHECKHIKAVLKTFINKE